MDRFKCKRSPSNVNSKASILEPDICTSAMSKTLWLYEESLKNDR